ncbi:MAG: glycosyltransferase [Ruminococcaceae bacterium]|nr:glycosyltransferase [Oscillospiraceae bacterium]
MRILILTDNMDAGGAETHILTLTNGLISYGHTVFIASRGGRAAHKAKELGARHARIDLVSRSPNSLAKAYIKLYALCKHYRIDIIHAHARMAAVLGARVAERLRIPLVTTAHARFSVTPAKKLICRWGTLCAAVSEDIKQSVCKNYGISPENVRVIENGIDTDNFSPNKSANDDSLHIVFMSRMDCDCSKAARLLCAIAPKLHRRFPNLKITLAGGGNALNTVRDLATVAMRESDIAIRVIGHISDPKKLLQSADIFVGVSRAALEAMSCGAATVIAGDEGFFGIVDKNNFSIASLDNFCARICEKLSADKLCDSLFRLCSMDKKSLWKLGLDLREELLKTHRAELMTQKTLSMYRDAQKRIPCGQSDIVLCGYYGFCNIGDDALLRNAVLRAEKSFPKYNVCALTARGKRDEDRFGVRCVRRKSLAALREIKRAKTFIFGGGTLLQDITSKRSLLFYLFLLRYAQRNGVRCELWANGIGPLRVRFLRLLTSRALCGCSYIGTRDIRSAFFVRTLTNNSCVLPVVENDLAANTPPASETRVSFLLKYFGIDENAPFAVIAVKGSRIKKSDTDELLRLCHVLNMLRSLKYQLLFVEFFPREDHRLIDALAKRFDGNIAKNLCASDIVGIFSRAKLVCASRFHALVFARDADTPFLAFGTDPKITAFASKNSFLPQN